jgi:hypothetical protein
MYRCRPACITAARALGLPGWPRTAVADH